jgi:anti-sigma factor RsiW
MDESLHNDEALLRYLDDEMEPEEKRQFEIILDKDELLRQRLAAFQLAIEGLKQAGTAQRVKDIHTNMMAELKVQKKTTIVRKRLLPALSCCWRLLVARGSIVFHRIRFITNIIWHTR